MNKTAMLLLTCAALCGVESHATMQAATPATTPSKAPAPARVQHTAPTPVPLVYTADAFRHMERFFPMAKIARGTNIQLLPQGVPITGVDFAAFNKANRSTGMLLLHHGAIRYEHYFLGANAESHFTSWSVAKSFTSTMIGLALADGAIKSLDEPVTHYVPYLKPTAYANVTIAQALQMSSGVKFDETYDSAASDIAMYVRAARTGDANRFLLTRTQRSAPPGTKFNYNSSETQLLAAVARAALHQTLATYLSKKVWQKIGAEDDATWFVDKPGGMEIASMGINARLRDYARFGLMMAHDGVVGQQHVLPKGWVTRATTPSSASVAFGKVEPPLPLGYQYQWWVLPDGTFEAQGVFGQFIHVDRKRDLVIVKTSAWPTFWVDANEQAFYKFIARVNAAVDDEMARRR